MDTFVRPLGHSLPENPLELDPDYDQTIIDYYSKAGIDYEPWSRKYNMHFGYFRRGVNPFRREALLDEMNAQVLQKLQLKKDRPQQLIDLGCGVGATARYCAEHYPNSRVTGATIVPWQIQKAMEMTSPALLDSHLTFKLINYRHLPFADHSFDGAYAVESACYDHGRAKQAFLREAFRVLKPGARLVVADGFRKRDRGSRLFEACYKQVCRGWSLETFAQVDTFVRQLEQEGYEDIIVQDISWRISPSVLYVPWVSIKYLFSSILGKKGERDFQKLHFIAPMFGLIVGLHRRDYGYYHISARKPH